MPIRWSFQGLLHNEYGSRVIAEDMADETKSLCALAFEQDNEDFLTATGCDEYDLLYTLEETLGFEGEVGLSMMILLVMCGTTLMATYSRLQSTKP